MVELTGVTKRFGAMTAVDDVTLHVRPGEFLTLLGPSGCGKTTMLRMISGFETPTAGRVVLGGRDVTGVPPYRREVNQVFQSYALFPHLSVSGNIAFGLKMKGVGGVEMARRVEEALAMVALTGLGDRRPDQLSGGQRQRVALARAVVNRPKVLLLDEPLSALDAQLRQATRVELKQLQATLGITFVFVTHDQDEALSMSDRVAVINKGKIEQLATPREIYERPATRFVATFVGETNLFPGTTLPAPAGTADAGAMIELASDVRLLSSSAAGPASAGVTVSIRPEAVRLVTAAETGANTFEATIESIEFRGATEAVRLRTPSGLVFSALLADAPLLQKGTRVRCHVRPEEVVVLRDEPAR